MLLVAGHAHSQPIGIVALGDSNTAGFGVGPEEAFPARLEAMLRADGHDVIVANAGRNADTFYGMLARLDSSVPAGTRLVILQGGYNDVLRRTGAETIAGSITAILSRLHERGIRVVLCGFFYPDWDALGRALASTYGAVFVDGSACYDMGHRGWDGLHMTAVGHQVVASRLTPLVERLLGPTRTSEAHSRGGYAAVAKRPMAARPNGSRASVVNPTRRGLRRATQRVAGQSAPSDAHHWRRPIRSLHR